MAPLRLAVASILGALATVAGCYQRETTAYSTFPEPTIVAGPPGGEIDPAWTQPQYSQYPGYPDGYPGGYPAGTEDVAAAQTAGDLTPSADPNAPGYVMGGTNDTEISSTLSPYGEWVQVEGGGYVWRPYATVVGLDFTPYESCGTWVWTDDWGWTFACEWDWGWLPFHYGRWGWYDDYWAWEPGYEWSPAWVEWRSGDGYVGWRPLAPTGGGWQIRDHRTGNAAGTDWAVNDGRAPKPARPPKLYDSHWRFAAQTDFGKRIRPNLFKAPAEGLRRTALATRPPMRGMTQPVSAASVMRGRLSAIVAARAARDAQRAAPPIATSPRPPRAIQVPMESPRSFDRPARPPQVPTRSFDPPTRSYDPPPRPIDVPSRSYDPPSRSSSSTWTPSHSSSRHDDPPSRSTSSSGGNWSPPAHSSSPSHSSGGSSSPSHATGSFGGGGGGGGRGHRR